MAKTTKQAANGSLIFTLTDVIIFGESRQQI